MGKVPPCPIGRSDDMAETLRAVTDNPPRNVVRPFRPFSSLVRVDIAAQSHPGRVRANNEDQFLVTKLQRSHETMLSSLPPGDVPERAEEVNYVMIVADGMGGHAAGEVASRLAISTLVSLVLDFPDWIFKVDDEGAPEIERRARETRATGQHASLSSAAARTRRCAAWDRRSRPPEAMAVTS